MRTNFHFFKFRLHLCSTTIRLIPVTKIFKQTPLRPSHTPVSDFMQSGSIKATSKNNPVVTDSFIRR
ncbi:Uncharacterised protein [Vibrio cholerae]|uniref:Uncharacterized protein n=1 Tax=Vibrio cholerae TaxID=666 RepID=A0A655NZV2_VIBCL|nr:Uncharacterised protein [Vibrio cholerae]